MMGFPSPAKTFFCASLAAGAVLLPLHPATAQPSGKQAKLAVPGANLYYETFGSGPLFVIVPGANGTAFAFQLIKEVLGDHFTVVLFDRRGFARSPLTGRQDYGKRLETEADDVRRLIEHLSNEPAVVFGSSSGGLIALELLSRYPL